MKNILITGGAGYIGSTVAHLLIDKGYSLTIIDSLITGDKRLVPKKAILKVVDISDKKKIKKILDKKNLMSLCILLDLFALMSLLKNQRNI